MYTPTHTIRLSQVYDKIITSRSAITSVIEKSPKVNIILDFDEIQFINRSACQQIEIERVNLDLIGLTIKVMNVNETIARMLSLVQLTSLVSGNESPALSSPYLKVC